MIEMSKYAVGLVFLFVFVGLGCDDEDQEDQISIPLAGNSTVGNQSLCTDIAGVGAVEGEACNCGGVWQCSRGSFVCEGGSPLNACGGCQSLNEVPNTACGECGQGVWTCNGTETITCDGSRERNVCGGCAEIQGSLDAPCGQCGVLICDGQDALFCEERPRNECGSCGPLEHELGSSCGECGTWVCSDGALSCDDRGEAACRVNRLILMGDTGEASETQYRVAAGAQRRCDRAGGCDGFVMLGDNIYDIGAQSAMDQQLTDKIDLPYANLKLGPPPAEGEEDLRPRMPIYVSLGNHDLGGAGLNSAQVQYYLAYARSHDWFYYPSEYWEHKVGHVHLISIHTNPLAYSFPDGLYAPQGELVNRVVEGSTAPWKLAFGHHPYRSNGRHGNAGAYEGFPLEEEIFGFDVSGNGFRQWIDQYVCNQIDFYVSGHDHNRQWLESVPLIPNVPEGMGTDPCLTYFAVSGAGAKTTDFAWRGNDLEFGDDQEEGFLFMAFQQDRVDIEFCDADGNTEWSKIILR